MSETQSEYEQEGEPQETKVTDAPPAAPEQENEPQKEGAYAPRVDLDSLPEDIRKPVKDRFDHLSRLMKEQSRTSEKVSNEYRQLIEAQAARIDELTNATVNVVSHIQNNNLKSLEEATRREMLQAYEAGDHVKYLTAQEKLGDIKAEIRAQQKPKTPQPKQPTQQIQTPQQMANEARMNGEITENDEIYMGAWQNEKIDGQPLRPWAQVNHNLYQYAANETAQIFTSPVYANMTFEQKLSELDRRMGVKTPSNGQAVMGGSLTTSRKTPKIALSPQIERVATRLKFAGPKASDSEHISAYRKHLEESRKGAR